MASGELKWFDASQPQTLQGAVILCYLNAVFGLLALFSGSGIVALILLAEAAAGVAIANQKRWGYWMGVVLAVCFLGLQIIGLLAFVFTLTFSIFVLLNLAFAVILVALLLHRQSRQYQRVWFH